MQRVEQRRMSAGLAKKASNPAARAATLSCLLLEACEPIEVRGQVRWQNFDGDVTLQPRIARAIHLPIPPAPMAATIS
jgi:hypothetical protein